MRRFCLFLVPGGRLFVTSEELCAQNNPVYFPYVVNDGNTVTELLFTNTTSRDASLTLTGYKEDGTAVEGPAVVVRGHSQVVVSSFTGLSGWVLAESSVPGVVGNVRVRSADGSAQTLQNPPNQAPKSFSRLSLRPEGLPQRFQSSTPPLLPESVSRYGMRVGPL